MNTILLAVSLLATAFGSIEPTKNSTKETSVPQCTITVYKEAYADYRCPSGEVLDFSATGQCTVTAESCFEANSQATGCASHKLDQRMVDKLDITVHQCFE